MQPGKVESLVRLYNSVEKILKDGSDKAREIAIKKIKDVKSAIGLVGNIY